MSSSEHEPAGRSAASISFELDYWKAVLADTLELNTRVGQASAALAPLIALASELLAHSLISGPSTRLADLAAEILSAIGEVQGELRAAQTPITTLVEATDGRLRALQNELDESRG